MPRIAEDSQDLDLESTLKELNRVFSTTKDETEKAMYRFFEEEVTPEAAYTDNDVNQGKGGPKRSFVEGGWKRYNLPNLKVRLGVNPAQLIPALQLILEEEIIGLRMVVEYTGGYGPMFEYAKVHGKEDYELVLELASKFHKLIELYREKNRTEQQIVSV